MHVMCLLTSGSMSSSLCADRRPFTATSDEDKSPLGTGWLAGTAAILQRVRRLSFMTCPRRP